MEHEQEGVPGTAVEGEYSWVAPDGNEYHVKYVADRFGYRVVEDNVVPRMRYDVFEVIAWFFASLYFTVGSYSSVASLS
ncbi:cuticle protein CP575-like [Penaeus monodon]|nr:cuticle protein CP575-like [Penaeus monodon]